MKRAFAFFKRLWLRSRPRLLETLVEGGRTLLAILIAYLVAFAVIGLVSEDPDTAIRWFVFGPLSSPAELGEVVKNAAPLMFAGVAACLIIRGGNFNMFTEGAFYVGGLAAAVVSIFVELPGVLAIAVPLLSGIAAAIVVGFVPAVLKEKLGVNEFVSSIMFNFIVLWVGVWLISNVVIDVTSGDNATAPIPDASRLSVLVAGTNVTTGILIALGVAVLASVYLFRTRFGYRLRMTGDNRAFAKNVGIDVARAGLSSQLLGIGVAGLGGGVEILANYRRFNWKSLPGFGFDGFMVAIIAKNKPLLVPFAALFIGYLRSGADLMAFNSDVAQEVVQVIQGLILILVAAEAFFSSAWLRSLLSRRAFARRRADGTEEVDGRA
ncbi:MAG: ABC transporter permease [Candidatus Izemoplasmatales bacterium]